MVFGFLKGLIGSSLTVKRGNHVIDAGPYLDEALRALPYINPKYKSLFAEHYVKHFDRGTLARAIRKLGIPEDFFAELGNKRPDQAIDAIDHRVTFGIYRHARDLDEQQVRRGGHFPWTKAKCDVNKAYACSKAKALHGKTVSLDQRATFPLPGCDAEWCSCQWMYVRSKRR